MELKTARLTLLIDPNKKAAFERLCAQQDRTRIAGGAAADPRLPAAARRRPTEASGAAATNREAAGSGARRRARPRASADAGPHCARRTPERMPSRPPTRTGCTSTGSWWSWPGWLLVGVAGVARAAPAAPSCRRCCFRSARLLGPAAVRRSRRGAARRAPRSRCCRSACPALPFHLRLDALSAFFLLLLGGASARHLGLRRRLLPQGRGHAAGAAVPAVPPVPGQHGDGAAGRRRLRLHGDVGD
ncbi:MAG: hypothetical protein MZW92_34685 [Comamonadaceae bacterium]|nr:hypothetical protein [Comamonadaceae bacterium]